MYPPTYNCRCTLFPRRPRPMHWKRWKRICLWLLLGFFIGYGICFVLDGAHL